MKLREARCAIRKVAKKNDITEQEAVREIEAAIQAAFDEIVRKGDQSSMARWKEIPSSGDRPNAYELVAYLSDKYISNS